MTILQYIDDQHASDIIFEWDDDCLRLPLFGHYDNIRFYETMCAAQNTINDQKIACWTRIIEITDEAHASPESAEEMARQFNAFFLWAEGKGCYASAVVIPESQLSVFSLFTSVSKNLHNGVRLFFDKEIAAQWLSIQRQKHRKNKMH